MAMDFNVESLGVVNQDRLSAALSELMNSNHFKMNVDNPMEAVKSAGLIASFKTQQPAQSGPSF